MFCNDKTLKLRAKNSATIRIKTEYEYQEGDKIYFTAKKAPDMDDTDSEAIIKTDWTFGEDADVDSEGRLQLVLAENLTDVPFTGPNDKPYLYDIKLVTDGGVAQTFVFGALEILPAITMRA